MPSDVKRKVSAFAFRHVPGVGDATMHLIASTKATAPFPGANQIVVGKFK